ncbi:M48 family metalloprotease [Candidatus Babeliales bacterium]|nr:M48 family metalloprotease [Candidatus Babeliales bacterium]
MNTSSTYVIDQEKVKQETFTKDGISAVQLEKNIREKYPNIPKIILIESCQDSLLKQDAGINAAFNPSADAILLDRKNISQESSHALTWSILHEAGHAQQPRNISTINIVVGVTQLFSLYFWGIHKSKPYKNIFTKISSKVIAAIAIGGLVNCTLMRAEERRADNWANAHADQETLQGGIETLEAVKQIAQQKSQTTWDPTHPSIDSRIAKIKKTLKNRFGVDA